MAVVPDPTPQLLKSASRNSAIRTVKPGDPEPYIFGHVLCTPRIITANDSGDWLYVDLLWSRGEIEGVEGWVVDGNNFIGRYDEIAPVAEHYNGTADQVASPIMSDYFGGTYDTLPNIAHSVMFAVPGKSLDMKALIKGLKLYDPRTSPATTAYSTNPALALARIYTDCGYTMDWDSVATAANYCDELVGSPQAKRWEIGVQIWDRRELAQWAKIFAQYCSCFVDVQGSNVYLVPDEPRSSTHTVTAANMKRGVKVNRPGSSKVPERVVVSYSQLDIDFDEDPGGSPPYIDRTVHVYRRQAQTTAYTGSGVNTSLSMPAFTTFTMAGRHAVEVYNKAQDNMTIEFEGFDDGLKLTIGDIGTVTNAEYGISSKLMALIENKQVGAGRWRRKYQAYNASNYSDAQYNDTDFTLITLGNPNDPPSGPTPTLSTQLITGGTTYNVIVIQFQELTWAYMQDYRVLADDEDNTVLLDTHITHVGSKTIHSLYTDAVKSGVQYRVRIWCRSVTGAYSSSPGVAYITPNVGTEANLDVGDVTNMHVYVLDGDAKYATTSEKTGSPLTGETWSSRFGSTSPIDTWTDLRTSTERFLENQIVDTTFETEVWDSQNTWTGAWKFFDLDYTVLAGDYTHYVSLADDTSSPISFTDYTGTIQSETEARYMKAKTTIVNSPNTAGEGLHIKLPVPVAFILGS